MVQGVTKRRSSRNTCQPSRYRAGSDLPTEFQDLVHTAAQVPHAQHSEGPRGTTAPNGTAPSDYPVTAQRYPK